MSGLNTLNRHTNSPAIRQLAALHAAQMMVSAVNGSNAIEAKDHFQPADRAGGICGGYVLGGIDIPQPQDSNESAEKKVEHRYYPRFRLNNDAYALIRAFQGHR